ncbi:MAG TPA: GGDEF domain-containing protein [Vicinamibacterales bacterium]|jgi:diguanylate cyclase (GGDEF)-like protein
MADEQSQPDLADVERDFRESRIVSLISVNLNTFWATAIIVMAFGFWDVFADPVHWRSAFLIRSAGVVIVMATGLFQKLPGKARWLPFMAKVRMAVAVVTTVVAAAQLDRGYGFGVAGLVVILLTGPYVAIDSKDLLRTNLAALSSLLVASLLISIDPFDVLGTVVFASLAVLVSTLLGRVLEASYRRAFTLELESRRDARTDALTGLDNRRAMQERGPLELKRARRSGAPVSVILCDLDHFKSINDRYGHETGDSALTAAAKVLRGALRETDGLGRWGGEEFMAILPATDARGAAEVAERMRADIAATNFTRISGGATISLGVATIARVHELGGAWDNLVKEADQHLYRAKSEGRNRVIS